MAASPPSDTWHLPPQPFAASTVHLVAVASEKIQLVVKKMSTVLPSRDAAASATCCLAGLPPRRGWSFLSIIFRIGLFYKYIQIGGLICQNSIFSSSIIFLIYLRKNLIWHLISQGTTFWPQSHPKKLISTKRYHHHWDQYPLTIELNAAILTT